MENQQQDKNEVSFCLHGKHLLQFKKNNHPLSAYFHAQKFAISQSLSNVEPMVHAAKMMTVVKDSTVKQVEDGKELKNKQIKKTVMPKPAISRHDLKMALMKRGMAKSVAN